MILENIDIFIFLNKFKIRVENFNKCLTFQKYVKNIPKSSFFKHKNSKNTFKTPRIPEALLRELNVKHFDFPENVATKVLNMSLVLLNYNLINYLKRTSFPICPFLRLQ